MHDIKEQINNNALHKLNSKKNAWNKLVEYYRIYMIVFVNF